MFVVVSLRIKLHNSKRLHRILNVALLQQDSLVVNLLACLQKLVLCSVRLVYF